MADRPPVQSQRLTRDKIALISKNLEIIKAFENLIRDVSVVLPDTVVQDRQAIENAQETADQAVIDAAAALSAANLASAAAALAQSLAATANNNAAAAQGAIDAHIADLDNPHETDKVKVGLPNVDNTSDMDKPVSTAQQAALDLKPNADNPMLTGSVRVGGEIIADSGAILRLRSYTVAGVPSASVPGRVIYVSNGTSNKRLAVSDGANWRWPDGAIVS